MSVYRGKAKKRVRVLDKWFGWDVRFVDRKKGERYRAACFDKSMKTREEVVAWVRQQPNLILEGEPE